MQGLLDLLNAMLRSDLWSGASLFLQILFFALIFRMGWTLLRPEKAPKKKGKKKRPARKPARRKAPPAAFTLFTLGLGLCFVGVLLVQARWQFFGGNRTEFVAFMQRHDKRPFNPAHHLHRGRLLDRNGIVLAESTSSPSGAKRHYPLAGAACHIVGYDDPFFGSVGLERSLNTALHGLAPGKDRWQNLSRDVLGGERVARGSDIATTLDAHLQLLAAQRMGDRRGAVVALDPRNGAVLALVSTPVFDPHSLSEETFQRNSSASPILNRAIQGRYPPGSTFKPLTALAGLRTGNSGSLHCPANGYTPVSSLRPIRDYGYYKALKEGKTFRGYGTLSMSTALAKSSNTYFAQLGVNVEADGFRSTLKQAGFGRPFTIASDPGEPIYLAPVALPALSDRDTYGLAQAGVGQGKVVASPMHMAWVTAAIANGGTLWQPRLTPASPQRALGRLCSPQHADQLSRMMREVVTHGTGRRAASSPYPMAGKTGTAEHAGDTAHAWFIGFAPVDRPRIAVCVLVEEGGFGSSVALPIAQAVMEKALGGSTP